MCLSKCLPDSKIFLLLAAEGAFCCACARGILIGAFGAIVKFSARFCGLSTGRRHFFKVLFGEGWKKMTSIPIFLTLWILVVFAGPSDEDILMIKVRTKHEKSPKTWSLRFDLLEIKMCRWGGKPWRLVLRCWCFTCKNHKVVCEDDRKIFDPMKEVNLERDLNLLQLWNKIALSSRWPQASNHFR